MEEKDPKAEAGDFDAQWRRASSLLSHHNLPSHVVRPPRTEEDLDRLCLDLLEGFRRAEDKTLIRISRGSRARPSLRFESVRCGCGCRVDTVHRWQVRSPSIRQNHPCCFATRPEA